MLTLRRFTAPALAVLLLATMGTLMVQSSRSESQTVDEGAHLASGYSYWRTGDFRLNPEHPPLIKLIASVPLLFLPIHLPIDDPSWEDRNEWGFAHQLLYHGGQPPDLLFLLSHLPLILLTLSLGIAIARWSTKLWGAFGGVLSLALFAFDPTFLAHGHYVTTDVGVSLFIFVTVYCFTRYLSNPSWQRAWPVAVFFALAQVTKFSAVFLWILLPLLWLLRAARSRQDRAVLGVRTAALFFLGVGLTTFLVVFATYGFELKPPMQDPELAQLYATGNPWRDNDPAALPGFAGFVLRVTNPATEHGKTIEQLLRTVPVPAYTFVRGFSQVLWHDYWGHDSYLLGQYRSTGWWYYFPVAFLVKTPFATVILLVLTALYFGRLGFLRCMKRRAGRRTLFEKLARSDFAIVALGVSALLYLAFSMASKINLGIRHLLPMYPFLFVLAGSPATIRFRRFTGMWRALLGALVVLLAVSVLRVHPHYLSYFSELFGGAEQGARYLTDSNLDWGQSLKQLGVYMREHDIPFVYITYFGQAPLEQYLPDFRYLPTTDEPDKIAGLDGWVAISATALFSRGDGYAWLRAKRPAAKVGYSIYLYDLRKAPDLEPAASFDAETEKWAY